MIDGKAKLVKENFCDGFGDCIGECPTGALTIEERDADEYDEDATRQNLMNTHGAEAVKRFEEAGKVHAAKTQSVPPPGPPPGGCPGHAMRMNMQEETREATSGVSAGGPKQAIPSELNQWPVQLHLVQPGAPFFKNKELVVISTCSPVASADVHWRFIRGRSQIVACPKLDRTEPYVEKMAAILSEASIPKVIVLRMEVPCCGGLTMMVREAVAMTGRSDLEMEEVVVSLNGDINA